MYDIERFLTLEEKNGAAVREFSTKAHSTMPVLPDMADRRRLVK